MNLAIPAVHIETNGDEILIQQDQGGTTHYVSLHLVHVKCIAERLGLVATTDPNGPGRIEALSRRLRVLHGRLDRLTDYLLNHSDHAHADLDWETTYCTATLEIADEFVADLHDAPSDRNPIAPKSPEIGGVEEPQKRVASTGPQGELL
jgi:hypothetical protein